MFEMLKKKEDKNKVQSYINSLIFLGLDKNTGSLVYFNLD